jgi:hypothetical protein
VPKDPETTAESTPASLPATRAVLIAQRSIVAVRLAALGTLAAGFAFWGILIGPMAFSAWWQIALAGLLLVICLLPALVLGLLYFGLRQLVDLPTNARESVKRGWNQAAGVARTARADDLSKAGRGLGLFRGLWLLWKTVSESRDLLMGAAALARLANPVSLVIVLAAFGVGLFEALFVIAFLTLRMIL